MIGSSSEAYAIIGGVRVVVPGALPHISPFDGAEDYRLAETSPSEVSRAVALAADCHRRGDWRLLPLARRREVFERWAGLIERDADMIAALDHADMGKPLAKARSDAAAAAQIVGAQPWYLELMEGSALTANPDTLSWLWHAPVGVVAAITPWNYASINCVWKIAPALAAGNCVVLKPSEIASRSALHIVALGLDAGLPENALHCVPGSGAGSGTALVGDALVDLVTFTGSTAAARHIAAASARFVRPAILECGGKSPQIVMPDMGDAIAAIVPHLADAAFANAGQLCVAKTRLLVHRAIAEDVIAALAEAMSQHWPGGPDQPDAPFGPLATRRQKELASATLLQIADRGGRVIRGPAADEGCGGHYQGAAIGLDSDPATPGWQEELFAPVLHVGCFDNAEEAIRLANSTDYALSASVWTRDTRAALAFAREVSCGEIMICGRIPADHDGAPPHYAYSPTKASGHGVEGGIAGLKAYCQARSITMLP